MKRPSSRRMNLASLIALAWLPWSKAVTLHMTIGSCEDLQAAAAATSTSDVEAEMVVDSVTCDEWTTLEITNNRLKLTNPSVEFFESTYFVNVRFVVYSVLRTDMITQLSSSNAESNPSDMNGALLYVAEGGRARFMLSAFFMDTTVVDPATGEGGCVHNEGLIRFEGDLNMQRCIITDTTGSLAPSGGGMWVGELGQVVVKHFISQQDCQAVSSSDSLESMGGGIYNAGKFTAFNDAYLFTSIASVGGGIYNTGVLKLLYHCIFESNRATGRGASHLFNSGEVLIKGEGGEFYHSAALAEDSDGGAVINTGSLTINKLAIFGNNQCQRFGGAIATYANATLRLTESTTFSENYVIGDFGEPYGCDDIYIGSDSGYTCGP